MTEDVVEPEGRPVSRETLGDNWSLYVLGVGFSMLTGSQVHFLRHEISDWWDSLPAPTDAHPRHGSARLKHSGNRVWGRTWLLICGCYEVLRFMSESSSDRIPAEARCFADPIPAKLQALKVRFAELRMPFTKQLPRGTELRGHYDIDATFIRRQDPQTGDLIFDVDGREVRVGALFNEFVELIESIEPKDVRLRLRTWK